MVAPLVAIPLALMGASAVGGAAANWYSQAKQRELYRYQRNAYVRQLEDYNRRNPTRPIRYPELSIPGHIRALDVGISQSYASSFGTGSRLASTLSAGGFAYGRSNSRSLYGRSSGGSSRYL